MKIRSPSPDCEALELALLGSDYWPFVSQIKRTTVEGGSTVEDHGGQITIYFGSLQSIEHFLALWAAVVTLHM